MSNLVNVIIPVYNVEDRIDRCVESIIFGEFKDLKVILVEDCSKDNSWEHCVNLANKYDNVVAYKNDKNSGVSFTRNRGIELSDSKYIIFVDSDDWVSGKFAKKLVQQIEKNPEHLVICGIQFIDLVNSMRTKYIWSNKSQDTYMIQKKDYFSLVEKFYLQSPINKIFVSDIIKKNNLLFDVNQSMGEDFQFVLDYMQCLKSEYCVVINEPLYYYIRYSNTSLMSQFGLKEKNHEFIKRIEQLYSIIGIKDDDVRTSYEEALKHTRSSYVYNIYRNKTISKTKKLEAIEYVMEDGNASRHLKDQHKLYIRENLSKKYAQIIKLPRKIKNKIIMKRNKSLIIKNRNLLTNSGFSIISQNCIGGVIYHDLGLEFLSPTVNLYFTADDFVKFVGNLKHYLSIDMQLEWRGEYPIGILEDITVHFMHYETCSDAKDAWCRRKERINFDKILVISTDMEGFNEDTYKNWQKIKYPKILLSVKKWQDDDSICFSQYEGSTSVPDLIPKREFYKDDVIINRINSL